MRFHHARWCVVRASSWSFPPPDVPPVAVPVSLPVAVLEVGGVVVTVGDESAGVLVAVRYTVTTRAAGTGWPGAGNWLVTTPPVGPEANGLAQASTTRALADG
jgi:hypothetical protein